MAHPQPDVEEISWGTRLYFDATGLIAILVAGWILLRFLEHRHFVTLGFARRRLAHDTGLGAFIGLGMVLLCLLVTGLGGWAEIVAPSSVSGAGLLLAAVSMLMNAALQELLCRSFVFQTIRDEGGVGAAVLLSSLFFTALHAGAVQDSVLAALNLFGAGVLLGLAYAWTNNLWMPIALHFVWNFSLGPFLGLSVSGQSLGVGHTLIDLQGPEIWTGGLFGIEASLSASLATLGGIGVLYLLRRRIGSKRAAGSSAPTLGPEGSGGEASDSLSTEVLPTE